MGHGEVLQIDLLIYIRDVSWTNDHIHSFINICGPLLGVPKTIASLLSGDMKDTAQLGIFESALVESLLSRKERAYLFRRWPCLLNMLPKGGNCVWSKEPMLHLSNGQGFHLDDVIQKLLIDSAILPPGTSRRVARAHNPQDGDGGTSSWPNPLENPLPNAPNMTIYSFYGVGKETEVGYHYKLSQDLFANATFAEMLKQCKDPDSQIHCILGNRKVEFSDALIPLVIDISVEDQEKRTINGVVLGDGDGTVPIRSLGLMGVHFWQTTALNPFGVKIVTREYLHEPVSMIFLAGRGGPKTSDHVDILGNHEMTFDILRIVSGNEGRASSAPSDLDTVHISLVKGDMKDLAEDISGEEIRKIDKSLGDASGVLYEQDITYGPQTSSRENMNSIPSFSSSPSSSLWCRKRGRGDESQYYGPLKKIERLLKSRRQKRILELQYRSSVHRLITEATELPLISNRYYSNIEEIAVELNNTHSVNKK